MFSKSLGSHRLLHILLSFLNLRIDAFLIAFVLIIFAYGIYNLFIYNAVKSDKHNVLRWIRIPSIGHLKNILAEVIVIILFVKFLDVAFLNLNTLKWEILVLPLSILMLSLGLKFLSLKDESGTKDK